jgi:DNA-binding CsgD family transcriptional regulator
MSISIVNDNARTGEITRAGAAWWSREIELIDRLHSLHATVDRELQGHVALPAVDWDVAWRAAEVISTLTHLCIERLRNLPGAESATAQRFCDLIMALQQLAMDWYLYETAMRGQRLADCAAGLARLRGIPGSAALLDNACQELVQRCGFHRAVLSQVDSHSWKPLMLHERSDGGDATWFSEWINQTVPLVPDAPEAEMLSRKRPSLVHDTASAPVYRPLIVAAGRSRSYVVAPVVLGTDVVGFLHTDHHPLDRRVDEADRDVAWAFADGFSHLYERAILIEQLQAHRNDIRELFFGALDRIDDLCESGSKATVLAADDSGSAPAGRAPVELTEREADVFRLMVTGASNQQIADKLVITEGTVKSHVKHILRKYGAVNRAQAIAWALNI